MAKGDSEKTEKKDSEKTEPEVLLTRLWKLIVENSVASVATGVVALLAILIASFWSFLTQGGLIAALGGTTATSSLPREAILIVKSSTCPFGWRPYERSMGRFVIGAGTPSTPSTPPVRPRQLLDVGGSDTHSITTEELPAHTHGGSTAPAALDSATNVALVEDDGTGTSVVVAFADPDTTNLIRLKITLQRPPIAHSHTFSTDGGTQLAGQPVTDNNMPPWLALTICERD